MNNVEKTKEIFKGPVIVFLAVAFIPAWILFLLPVFLRMAGIEETATVELVAWSAAMWMPGLGAIIATMLGEKKELKTLGLGKLGKKKIYLWAWLVPILAVLVTGVVSWLFGWGKFDPTFQLIRQAVEGLPDVPETALPLLLTAQIAAALTVAPLFNTLFALGEELGWRGYLLPKLLPLGQIPAMLISGVIWGIWHAPAILQGHNYPENPVLGVGMMIVFTVLLGIIFSWLYLKTKSPWAPALAHGTVNAVAGLPLLFLTDVNLSLGGSLTSVSGWLALAALVGILYWKREIPLK
ncbi:MAG: CPBP family intramembrane metalloprotease [Anaerolineales bacterium]|nr:CPBP family intramembrane metalloprotease [Anaerolineales bacterium]